VPISRRGLTAAGLALATVGAIGVTSTLNASAEQFTPISPAVPSPAAATVEVPPPPPPPPLPPGAAKKSSGPVKKLSARSAGGAEVETLPPLDPIAKYIPKGLPPLLAAKSAKGGPSQFRAQSAGGVASLAVPAATTHRFYAYASQTVDSEGAFATLTIAKPTLAPGDEHSLAEIAVSAPASAPSPDDPDQIRAPSNIVEVGWNVSRNIYGDDEPHLFVYSWTNGVQGCYNTCNFLSYAGAVKPGTALKPGSSKQFGIRVFEGHWYVYYDRVAIGVFPASTWAAYPFTKIKTAQWFGEITAKVAQSCTQMGTGVRPVADATAGAAEMRDMKLFIDPEYVSANIQRNDTHPAYYTAYKSDLFTNRLWYGGAGASAESRKAAGLPPC
jgi:hypothetical protein